MRLDLKWPMPGTDTFQVCYDGDCNSLFFRVEDNGITLTLTDFSVKEINYIQEQCKIALCKIDEVLSDGVPEPADAEFGNLWKYVGEEVLREDLAN